MLQNLFGRPLRFEPLEDRRLLSFTITAPTSGTFNAGQTVLIQWTVANVSPGSTISLCYDPDTVFNHNEHWIEVDQVPAANGSGNYSWNTTGVPAGIYYIAGYMFDGSNTFTFSHLTTSITISAVPAPTFQLTAPFSGTFTVGETVPIRWTAGNVPAGSTVSLAYDTDAVWNGNEQWIEVDKAAAPNGAGVYLWNTTGVPAGTHYYIAAYLFDGNSTFLKSHSLSPFTLTTAPLQTFVINGPASGSFPAGTQVPIQWTATHVVVGSSVSLAYDPDTTFNHNEQWIEVNQAPAVDGAGTYTWDTTGVPVGTYYMAGYLWNGGNVFTLSHLTTSITITAALTLDAPPVAPSTAKPLTADQLAPIVAEAEDRLTAALGPQVSTALAGVSFQIADLSGSMIGEASGKTILIDRDAAGYGWFVDTTPRDDVEFSDIINQGELQATLQSPAAGRADLLTAVMHEMGHELGYADDNIGDLMNATLPLGVRRTVIDGVPLD